MRTHRAISITGTLAAVLSSVGHAQLPTLSTNTPLIDVSTGGVQELEITTSEPSFYLVLGSASGTAGFTPAGSQVNVPLTLDSYTTTTLSLANTAPFVQTFGITDSNGEASASLAIPPAPSLAGLTLHHSAIQLDSLTLAIEGASEARPLILEANVPPFVAVSDDVGQGGQVITVTAFNGFTIDPGDSPVDLCFAFAPDVTSDTPAPFETWVGLDVIAVDAAANQVQAVVPNWWGPDEAGLAVQGKLMVAKGDGLTVTKPSFSPLFTKLEAGWVWEKELGGPVAETVLPFTLVAAPAAQPFAGAVAFGEPCPGAPAELYKATSILPDASGAGEAGFSVFFPTEEIAGPVYQCGRNFNAKPRLHSTKLADGTSASYIGFDAEIGCHQIGGLIPCPLGETVNVFTFVVELREVIRKLYDEKGIDIEFDTPAVFDPLFGTLIGYELRAYIEDRDVTGGQFSVQFYD